VSDDKTLGRLLEKRSKRQRQLHELDKSIAKVETNLAIGRALLSGSTCDSQGGLCRRCGLGHEHFAGFKSIECCRCGYAYTSYG